MGTEESKNQNTEQEVEKTVVIKGKTRFGPDQFGNPTPAKWKRISDGLRYFFTGLITIFAATNMVGPKTANIISLSLSIGILGLGAIDMGLGVSPAKTTSGEDKKDD